MLVLSRKIDDEIIIDENIVVRVLKVKGNTVRIGISAPSDVSIMRGELPRREVEFQLELEPETDRDSEVETEIRFERFPPTPPRRNRLTEIVDQINSSSR